MFEDFHASSVDQTRVECMKPHYGGEISSQKFWGPSNSTKLQVQTHFYLNGYLFIFLEALQKVTGYV